MDELKALQEHVDQITDKYFVNSKFTIRRTMAVFSGLVIFGVLVLVFYVALTGRAADVENIVSLTPLLSTIVWACVSIVLGYKASVYGSENNEFKTRIKYEGQIEETVIRHASRLAARKRLLEQDESNDSIP